MIGFTRIERGDIVVLARSDCAEIVADALVNGIGCSPSGKGGRGALLRFKYPEGTGLVRRYLRGGAIRHVMKDSYVLANRPLQEFLLHRHLLADGLPVPPLLGVCWKRRGVIYRGAIATGEIPAPDLLEHLRAHPGNLEVLRDCGALIRRMHDMRLWHADLQVKNILAGQNGLVLIDFDKARLMPRLTPTQRVRNLLRFRRSLEKRGFPSAYFDAVCEGYGMAGLFPWLDRLYRIRGRWSDWAGRRRMR